MILDILYKNSVKREPKGISLESDINKIENKPQSENIKRSLLKTISWRIIGTLDTVLISYLITGTMTMALSIGAWNKIKWGK